MKRWGDVRSTVVGRKKLDGFCSGVESLFFFFFFFSNPPPLTSFIYYLSFFSLFFLFSSFSSPLPLTWTHVMWADDKQRTDGTCHRTHTRPVVFFFCFASFSGFFEGSAQGQFWDTDNASRFMGNNENPVNSTKILHRTRP